MVRSYVLNQIRNDDLRSFIKNHVFLLVLLFLTINLSCENAGKDEFKSKANSPPVVTSARILPDKPNVESKLEVLIQSQDSDQDPVTHIYRWMKNSEEIVGENTYVLRNGNLKKGDLIQVNVTPSDGKAKGETFLSPPVEILNSPPVIKGITIEPKIAYVNDDLKAFVQGYDADGDSINYTYHWERNGVVLPEENTSTLAANRFKKGDSITVTVIPHDGVTLGAPKKTEPITTANSPPVITSIPPTRTEGNIYTYQVKAHDPDNDPVIFSLRTAPNGMNIDKETGIIRWEIREGDQRTQTIEIEASDSEGAKSFQRYTLSIEFK
jgi:hypothetical protein